MASPESLCLSLRSAASALPVAESATGSALFGLRILVRRDAYGAFVDARSVANRGTCVSGMSHLVSLLAFHLESS